MKRFLKVAGLILLGNVLPGLVKDAVTVYRSRPPKFGQPWDDDND